MQLDDVLITGPLGVNSVLASLNFRVDGMMSSIGGVAEVTLRVDAPGLALVGEKTLQGNLDSASGIFAGIGGSEIHNDFTTPLFTLATSSNANPNNVIQFSLSIYTGGGASSNLFDGGGVHFAADGPVFNLWEGFTANSVSGNIVDNRWVVDSATPNSVPEPTSVLLFALGSLICAVVAYRRNICTSLSALVCTRWNGVRTTSAIVGAVIPCGSRSTPAAARQTGRRRPINPGEPAIGAVVT
jgi:PEP-CTERM motif